MPLAELWGRAPLSHACSSKPTHPSSRPPLGVFPARARIPSQSYGAGRHLDRNLTDFCLEDSTLEDLTQRSPQQEQQQQQQQEQQLSCSSSSGSGGEDGSESDGSMDSRERAWLRSMQVRG